MPEWDQQAKQSIPAAANLFAYHMLGNSVAIIVIAIPVMIRTKGLTKLSKVTEPVFNE
ncbi:unnamed protein product [Schistosoma mattheei]|uniref:Uncharacterized protein n=1 Tax=Schistosoma mattheei TaxID=31246 RepID=A0A183PTB2_9TREM|nr:unnamed protein product [Schistosoma mattheei]